MMKKNTVMFLMLVFIKEHLGMTPAPTPILLVKCHPPYECVNASYKKEILKSWYYREVSVNYLDLDVRGEGVEVEIVKREGVRERFVSNRVDSVGIWKNDSLFLFNEIEEF
jgi:hypothetical protein